MEQVITRFAPSPTGPLHLGGLRTALFSYAYAKQHNGKFLLRIEDTDRSRYVRDSDEELKQILTDFNIHWDNQNVLYQSKNIFSYLITAEKLLVNEFAYKCYCPIDSSEECKCSEHPLRSPGNKPFCIKLKMPKIGTIECADELRGTIEFDTSTLKDIVLIKQDKFPTYHLASVVDDIAMEVTDVFRGEEWISSLPYHIYLYQLLCHHPPKFYHLPLILDPLNNCKLSKRNNNASVKNYLDMGIPKEAILNYIATLGYSVDDEFFTLDDFILKFSIDNISKHSACFDIAKLKFYSRSYLNLLSDIQLYDKLYTFMIEKTSGVQFESRTSILHAVSIFRTEISTISELHDKIYNLVASLPDCNLVFSIPEKIIIEGFRLFLKDIPPTQTSLAAEEVYLFINKYALSNKTFHPTIRRSLTGSNIGYQIHDIVTVLGFKRAIDRLFSALKK